MIIVRVSDDEGGQSVKGKTEDEITVKMSGLAEENKQNE